MFDPPSALDLVPDVAEAVRYFGHVLPSAETWLAEKLSEFWFDSPERAIIRLGERLSVEQLVELTFSQWEQIGQEAWGKLSDEGKKRGAKAFGPTISRASGRYYLAKEYFRLRRDLAGQLPFEAVAILTTNPRMCCQAARALDGVLFRRAQDLPTLPLPVCEYDICGCAYRGFSAPELRRLGLLQRDN